MYGPVRFSDYNFTKCEKDLPESNHMDKEAPNLWNNHEDKPYIPQAAYGQSKSANVLFSVSLNNKLLIKSGVLSVAVRPGVISTELARHIDPEKLEAAMEGFKKYLPGFLMKDLEQGCSTTLVAALDPMNTKDDMLWGRLSCRYVVSGMVD